MRLQKFIADSGYCSRRKAEELILKGLVKVNGVVIRTLGTKVSEKDEVMVLDNLLTKEEKVYILMNKPRGVITTVSDDKKRKTVIDLVETDKRIYPVGRLDYDTTGALLLTNDGKLANGLMHPKREVDKVYLAKVKGIITGKDIHLLENGLVIGEVKTAKAKAKLKRFDKKNNVSFVELTIHEGHNHQVKKMFEKIGHEVIKLTRIRYAFLGLTGLQPGEYRFLNPKEVKKLYVEAGLTTH